MYNRYWQLFLSKHVMENATADYTEAWNLCRNRVFVSSCDSEFCQRRKDSSDSFDWKQKNVKKKAKGIPLLVFERRSFSRLYNARREGSADNEQTRRREKSRDLIKLPGELRDSITILMIIRGKPQGCSRLINKRTFPRTDGTSSKVPGW